jgi:hypothetical protein
VTLNEATVKCFTKRSFIATEQKGLTKDQLDGLIVSREICETFISHKSSFKVNNCEKAKV